MASFTTFFPNAYNSQTGTAWNTTNVGFINNGVSTPDGLSIVAEPNSTSTITYGLQDMPSDFGKALTLLYNVRYRIQSLAGDTETLFIRIFKADLTTPLTDEMTVTVRTATVAFTNSGAVAFTGLVAGTKADWDGAVMTIRTLHNATHGADDSQWLIDEVEFTGTYDSKPTTVLNTADAHDFGVDPTPTLEFTGTDQESADLEYEVQVLSAIDVVVDSYSESNQNSFSLINDSASAAGQSFTGDGNVLDTATFYIKKTGSPTGGAVAVLYAHSGTFGTSSVPTGTVLATSEPLDISTLTTSYALIDFIFGDKYTLVNTTKYCIAIQSFDCDNTNYIDVGTDSTPSHAGNYFNQGKSTLNWSDNNGFDTCFYVKTHTVELDKLSSVPDLEFLNTVTSGDTHPFNSGEKISYTVQDPYDLIEYNESNGSISRNLHSANVLRFAQSFTGIARDLKSVDFEIGKTGSPTGNATAVLYAHTGTFGSGSLPTGTALATSNTLDVTTIPTSTSLINFTFATPYTLISGTKYVISIEYSGGDASNYIRVTYDNTSPTHEGNKSEYVSSWISQSTSDVCFRLYFDGGLPYGTWYWRARATDPSGTNEWGVWSAVRSFTITSGPQTYNVSLTLSSDNLIPTSNIGIFFDTLTLSSDNLLSTNGGLTFDETLNLSGDSALITTGGISFDKTLILTSDNLISNTEFIDFDSTLTLTTANLLTTSNIANMLDSITLSSDNLLTTSNIGSFFETLTLTTDNLLSNIAGLSMDETLNLSGDSTLISSIFVNFDSTLILTTDNLISNIGNISFDDVLNLSGDSALITSLELFINPTLTLTTDNALSAKTGDIFNETIVLSGGGVFVVSNIGSFFDTLTLSSDNLLTTSNIGSFFDTLTLSSDNLLTTSNIGSFYDTLTLSSDNLLTTSNIGSFFDMLTLSSDNLLSTTGGLALNEVLNLSGDSTLVTSLELFINPTLTLTTDNTLSTTEFVEFNATLTLSSDNTVSDNNISDMDSNTILTSDVVADMTLQTLSDAITNLVIATTLSTSDSLAFLETLTLSSDHADLYEILATYVNTLTLPLDTTLTPFVIGDFVNSLNLNIDISDTYSSTLNSFDTLTLTSNNTISVSEVISTIYEESIDLTASFILQTANRKSPFLTIVHIKKMINIKKITGL